MLPSAIKPAGEALEGCDVIVALGGPVFRYYPFVPGKIIPAGSKLFQITDNPTDNATAWIGDAFFADPARAAAILAEAVGPSSRPKPAPRPALPEPKAGSIITADFLYHLVEKVRPADSLIAQESLSTLKQLRQRIPTVRPRSFFSMSSGVLGYGLPAAVGGRDRAAGAGIEAQDDLPRGRRRIQLRDPGALHGGARRRRTSSSWSCATARTIS